MTFMTFMTQIESSAGENPNRSNKYCEINNVFMKRGHRLPRQIAVFEY
jgi:hypothetical protein